MSSTHAPVSSTTGTTASTTIVLPTAQEREDAVQQAQECLQAVRGEDYQLDSFNLLGVVANPRSGPLVAAAAASSTTTTTNSSEEDNLFTDAVHSLEYGLAQVTEQIETLNLFLEELSRQYLGDDSGESLYLEYYYNNSSSDDQDPILLARQTVPPQLSNLQLTDLQSYLEECGVLAHSLFAQGLETHSLPLQPQEDDPQQPQPSVEELGIPSIFFDPDFDLTQPETFERLLLLSSSDDESNNPTTTSSSSTSNNNNALTQPAQELIPVQEPDHLATHLDQVELALQEQVRSKSEAFFQETARFRQLQHGMEDLLEEVQAIRSQIQAVLQQYQQTRHVVSHQRVDYERLAEVLDATTDLMRAKASIGGLLSANDHWGAAQQIQYGRQVLQDLQSLQCLATCADQLKQYESLVIQNLSEELVDAFCHWRGPSEKERVVEMVRALQLCHALPATGELYQRRLQQTIRMTMRTTIAEFVESTTNGGSSAGGSGVTGMTYPAFFSCLELLLEELETVLKTAQQVDTFCEVEAILEEKSDEGDNSSNNNDNGDKTRWTHQSMVASADLAAKSIAEVLRLRKEVHSLVSLEEMKQLWEKCMKFTLTVEDYTKSKSVGLRSTLAGQAKAFLDRKHESNMSSLVAALDSERWGQCEVSAERQAALTRLCMGRAVSSRLVGDGLDENGNGSAEKRPTAEVDGKEFKAVWSCLLLVEMIMTNLSAAAHFQSLASNAVAKVSELLRLFNSRTTQLVLGTGAIHSAARLKSINAKHLSMVVQSLRMTVRLFPHIRYALIAQLPSKQHALLNDLDKIKKDYLEHTDKVLNKFVAIVGQVIGDTGLGQLIAKVDFDARAKDPAVKGVDSKCCVYLDGVETNTRKMHHVLNLYLQPDDLPDAFSRIFAYVDETLPNVFIAAAAKTSTNGAPTFHFPRTDEGKLQFLREVEVTLDKLNQLKCVQPWDFTCVQQLERKLDYKMVTPSISLGADTDGDGEASAPTTDDEALVLPATETAAPVDETTPRSDANDVAESNGHETSAPATNDKTLVFPSVETTAAVDETTPQSDANDVAAPNGHEETFAVPSLEGNGDAVMAKSDVENGEPVSSMDDAKTTAQE